METWREDALPGHTHDPDEVTVRIDGPGHGPAEPPTGDNPRGPADGPVFVDETGRRSRRYRRVGVGVGVACGVYALVIVGTLLSGNSSAPWLPVRGPKDDGPASKVETSDRQTGPAPSDPSHRAGPSDPSRTPSASDRADGHGGKGKSGDGPRPSGERDSRGMPGAPPGGDGADRAPDGGAPPATGPRAPGPVPAPGPTSGTTAPVPTPAPPADPPPSDPPTQSPDPGGTTGGGGGDVPAGYTPPAQQPPADTPPPPEAAE
ncbi:hypothetical protein [Streptomyces sp. NPDC018059]|uniref:hypothetical protein n=1 Tax=Streptomyces sp. NPDC018059 TaxID=3365041 RepID=UPI00378D887C